MSHLERLDYGADPEAARARYEIGEMANEGIGQWGSGFFIGKWPLYIELSDRMYCVKLSNRQTLCYRVNKMCSNITIQVLSLLNCLAFITRSD